VYDMRETGLCSTEDFRRVLAIFFGDSLNIERGDIEFVLRLTKTSADGKIEYREFCKFLVKRFIRSFKHVQNDQLDRS
jgi:Ca2+-binding EF-hand superfamily protein